MVVIAWLIAFAITGAVELAVVRALVRGARPVTVLVAQAATHPAVWLGLAVLPLPSSVALFLVETAALSVESAIYRRWLGVSLPRAIAASALANAASLAVGIALAAL